METVNNLASAASKVIWGDASTDEKEAEQNAVLGNETAGQEPRSGELGDVKAGEPYDKGNVGELGTVSDTKSKDSGTYLAYRPSEAPNTVAEDTTTTSPPTSTSAKDSAPESSTIPDAAPIKPHQGTNKTDVTRETTHTPSAATTSTKPTSSDQISSPDSDLTSPDYNAPPLTARDESKYQGTEKPGAIPGVGESEKIKETKSEADRILEGAKVQSSTPGAAGVKEDTSEVGEGKDESEGKEKLSLKDKIKAKLHKHKDT